MQLCYFSGFGVACDFYQLFKMCSSEYIFVSYPIHIRNLFSFSYNGLPKCVHFSPHKCGPTTVCTPFGNRGSESNRNTEPLDAVSFRIKAAMESHNGNELGVKRPLCDQGSTSVWPWAKSLTSLGLNLCLLKWEYWCLVCSNSTVMWGTNGMNITEMRVLPSLEAGQARIPQPDSVQAWKFP